MADYTCCNVCLSILFFPMVSCLIFSLTVSGVDISSDIHPKLGYMSMYFQDFPLTISQGSV